jgi:carboxyl-terminal processing protease
MKKVLLFLIIIISIHTSVFTQNNTTRPIDKLNALVYYLESFYVDSLEENKIVESGINGILKDLDPHSYYLTAKELKESEEPLQGNFEGIGIQFNIFHDTIMVVSPISGGPSEKVGIRSGDKIIRIDDTLVAGTKITNNDVFKWLRGKKGTKVKLRIKRKGEKELLDFLIIRDKIPVFSVDASYMAAPGIGYIKINRFSGTTMDEYKQAIEKLLTMGAKNLILDLSDNSGGYLNAAVDLADEFLKSGELIVYTEGITNPRKNYTATAKGNFHEGRLVVMINEGSASASEIVSGAIQDLDRGIIIGRRSFGKGLVQNTFPFPDGSAVRLTTARYYTPSGRFIQAPYENGVEKYYEDLYSRYKNGELTDDKNIKFPDSLKYSTRNKRTVYGGGGIMPDLFMPLDTSFYSDFLMDITRNNIINEFCIEYVDANREKLKQEYPSFDVFEKKFSINEDLWKSFINYAEKNKVKAKEEQQVKTSRKFLEVRIKGAIAQNQWGREEFFKIWNSTDPTFLKAVEVIQKGSFPKITSFK